MPKMIDADYNKEFRDRLGRLPATMTLDPTVKMIINGQIYTLEVDNRAVKDFYKDTGFNLLGAGLSPKALEDPDIIGKLIHRALQRHHTEITLSQADELISVKNSLYIHDCIMQCLDVFIPDMSDVERVKEPAREDPPNQ